MNKCWKKSLTILLILLSITVIIPASIVNADEEDGYIYSGHHWAVTTVYFDHTNIANMDVRTAITLGASTWNAAPPNFNMYAWSGSNYDWYLDYIGNYYPALTFHSVNGANEITWIATYLNSYYTWSTDGTPTASEYDVQTIAVHEFGHWLNLGDLEEEYNEDEIMYHSRGMGEVQLSLGSGDEAGIDVIY